ncbi:amidohydrolase family protein [Lacibacter sediminis]|uniref:Amidohydrolase family protein n=1 Tax=Lacibacter sediminis TaxID=2760713 RepID=A0A7G5XBA8_9BACT|nr:amidohydrolase family protein [Lacibacter sediminis]QNA42761.1 amidohydrolase family protein [Lacibacter sediminis]
MKIIDTHQHFWKYDPVNYSWINDEMQVIRKDFLLGDLAVVVNEHKLQGTVAVQADQTEAETDWLLQLAAKNDFIKGVVGWVDLRSSNIEERLQHYQQFSKLKGFRHVLQGEEPSFMLQQDFINGISKLQQYNFTYDILIFPKHLTASLELVQQFPEQKFVIDHVAKPYIKDGKIDEWKTGMQQLAKQSNVYCKISGMVTEADWKNWTADDLRPCIDVVVESFGIDRIMYGSDWPVCLVASSYKRWLQTVKDYFSSYSTEDQEKVFSSNAIKFYKL